MQNVPHKSSLPEGIRPGTVMRIRGLVPPNASRFHVNLLCGEEQGSDAALHFNPRLDTSEVVFNSKEQGSWGREERGPGVPFQRGQPFEVLIIASDDGFKVRLCDRGVDAKT
uniref:Galectin n=1 Tax=Pan paniscus TaxID=9597 RepID=A0A2R9BVT2_PANPA